MRLIDADALIEKLSTFNDRVHGDTHFICGIESAKEIIQNEPTVDAEPVRHGKWIKADSQQYFRKHYPCFTCSECGYRKDSQKKWNYCPFCGARMDME